MWGKRTQRMRGEMEKIKNFELQNYAVDAGAWAARAGAAAAVRRERGRLALGRARGSSLERVGRNQSSCAQKTSFRKTNNPRARAREREIEREREARLRHVASAPCVGASES